MPTFIHSYDPHIIKKKKKLKQNTIVSLVRKKNHLALAILGLC